MTLLYKGNPLKECPQEDLIECIQLLVHDLDLVRQIAERDAVVGYDRSETRAKAAEGNQL